MKRRKLERVVGIIRPEYFDCISNAHTHVIVTQNATIILYNKIPVLYFNDQIIRLLYGNEQNKGIKLRMNQASMQFDLKYHVYQKNDKWYIEYNNETLDFNHFIEIKRVGVIHTHDDIEFEPVDSFTVESDISWNFTIRPNAIASSDNTPFDISTYPDTYQ